ncbi:MAG: TRAP transporter substrate-binding protein [Elusimicrobiota bacterium]|jgi:tripartite ATP-independent transporter DctP family solute receptor|nr:TRAP transporter substrate-binding protein [Elusimicrobiota bacterium]
MKKLLVGLVSVVLAFAVIGCGGKSSGKATRELKFAHNHNEKNPSHIALLRFAEIVEKKTNGEITIKFFPNAILGDDRTVVEQVQNGSIDFTRVSANTLENFNPEFKALLLPYLFKTDAHFYKTLESDTVKRMYDNLSKSGMIGLTYQDAGLRSFYMKSAPITQISDLKGKKIRVINSQSSIRMLELLGGVPVPIPYGEIYTALQQGVIDGAENNVQALVLDKHGEVAKFYSLDGHVRLTDFVVISLKTWESLSPEHQKIIREALQESTKYHNELWKKAVEDSTRISQKDMGVKFNDVDKDLFEAAVQPMYQEAKKDPIVGPVVEEILILREIK